MIELIIVFVALKPKETIIGKATDRMYPSSTAYRHFNTVFTLAGMMFFRPAQRVLQAGPKCYGLHPWCSSTIALILVAKENDTYFPAQPSGRDQPLRISSSSVICSSLFRIVFLL